MFSDSVDFEAYSSETESGRCLIMTAESGCDPEQFLEFIEAIAQDDSSLSDEAREAFLASSLTGSCYDWDSGYRFLIVKKAAALKCSFLEHDGVKLGWPELISTLRTSKLLTNNDLKNNITDASLSLIHEGRDQGGHVSIFNLSTQALSGYVLVRGEPAECLFVNADSEASTEPAEILDNIGKHPNNDLTLDETPNSGEAKDDLLSGLNMYSLIKGDPLSDDDIEAAINIQYSTNESADDELAAVLARWS